MTEQLRAGLQVAPLLAEFVESHLLAGLPLSAEEFWSGYASLLQDLAPRRRTRHVPADPARRVLVADQLGEALEIPGLRQAQDQARGFDADIRKRHAKVPWLRDGQTRRMRQRGPVPDQASRVCAVVRTR